MGDQYTITYTITDACDRTASCTQTFTIDSAEPTISCAADITVTCFSDIAVDLNSVSTSAACGDNGNVTADGPNPATGNSACGESDGDQYTITYTITDACGRTESCTQTFTIDSAEPTISCAADVTVSCFSDIVVDLNSVSTSAACGDNGNVTADGPNPVAGNSACGDLDGDQYTITYTITDQCGRTAECTQTFTIDSEEPTITCPSDKTVTCYTEIAAESGSVVFSTGCSLAGNVEAGPITPVGNNSTCGELDGDQYTITYTLTDDCGRTVDCTQTFTIDSAEPTVTCPEDRIVTCLSEVVARVDLAAFTTACSLGGIVEAGPVTPSASNSQCGEVDGDVYMITYTLTDDCGRTAECTQTFTIDSAEPTIYCPRDETVTCLNDVVSDVSAVTTTASCGNQGTVTVEGPIADSGNSACGELDGDKYTFIYTITDECGRSESCEQVFTIDSEEPTITCAADETVSCLADIVVDINSVSTTAACGGNGSVTADGPNPAAGNSACGELDGDQYTITYTITDACGRTAECTQTFTIDSAEPTISCPADETVECLADVVANISGASSTGSCGDNGNITVSDPIPGAGNSACGELDGDTYTITYTVTDACGRTATCDQVFTIDSAEPTISCPADETVSCLEEVIANVGGASSTGSCGNNGNITASDPIPGAGNSTCGELDGDTYIITYTVTDACGRTATCDQVFTIDSAEPTISCPADETVTCLADVVANIAGASSTGSCGDNGNITASDPLPAAGNSACGELDGDTYTITYTVTDQCGRTASCDQVFTIDSDEPTITCPADETVSCLADVVANVAGASSTGSCGDNGSITSSDPLPAAGNSACGELDGDTYTITYTVTDQCGRTASCDQVFTIDSDEPTITCPADETVSCLADVVADVAGASSTGSCGDNGNITASDPIPGAGNSACGELDGDTYTITYTVTDQCGRTASCDQLFTIDSDEPTITCPADETVSCLADVVADVAGASSTGSCGDNGSITASDPIPGSGNSACGELDGDTYTITYTVTDACGRTATCDQVFTIDSDEPTVTCPADATVTCLAEVAADIAGASSTGSCGDNGSITASDPIPGANNSACGELDGDTYTITYTVTDACGRTATCDQVFTIDSDEPTVTCPADATVTCLAEVAADIAGASSTGSCGDNGSITASDPIPGANNSACGELDGDTYTITYTVTDACGRTATCDQVFTIDSDEPTVSCPADATVTCLAEVAADIAGASSTGSCGDNGSITASDPVPGAGNSACGELDGDTYTITYTVTDACGRTATCDQVFTIDSDEPTVSCPADATVTCLAEVAADIAGASSTGSCGDNGSITASDPVPGANNSACGELDGDTYTITYTVTDACGRTASCDQVFTIDSDEPTVTCPADATVTCLAEVIADIAGASSTGSCGDNGNITASDPVPGANNSACGELDGDTYTITYTVTDACGRTASCDQVFTIDSDEPTVTCPADATVTCLAEVVADMAGASSTGSCGDNGNITASDPVPGANNSACGELDGDTYTITYTVTDACGRTASCDQVFTIDSDEPTVTCPADATVTCLAEVSADIAGASSTGSCGDTGSITASDPVPGAGNSACGELDGDTYTITYTVTDACGRTASCDQVFTIDSDEPTVSCPADATVTCLAEVAADIAGASSTGSCGDTGSVTASAPVPGANNSACGELDGDTYTITYTVTDACGRTASCDQVFTIDSEEPTVSCPANATVTCLAEVAADIAGATSTGSCGDTGSVTASAPVPGVNNSACGELDGDTYTITYTVTDACGRTASCDQVFTIDSEEPTVTCPADATVTCLAEVVADIAGASGTGSCGNTGSITASGPEPGAGNSACGELDGDTYTITYTVTDACGRTASCDQVFTIDSEEPTVSCAADATVTCLADVVADIAGTTSTGSCGDTGNITASAPVPGANNSACGELDGDTYTITYTVTDACGRTASCDQVFTIDSGEPTISCAASVTVSCKEDIVADPSSVTATGSCGDTGNVTAGDPVLVSGTDNCDGAVYEITYTVTDQCGRTASCAQTVTLDVPATIIDVPADVTVICEDEITGTDPTVTVGCGVGYEVVVGDLVFVSGTRGCDGAIYEINYTVTTDCGEVVETTTTFTIDNSGTIDISCDPDDIVIECAVDGSNQTEAENWNQANIDKLLACSGASCAGELIVTSDFDVANATGSCAGNSLTVKYTIQGPCGELVEKTAFLSIEDNAAPTISVQDITVSIDPATGTVSITEGDIVTSADDSCTEVMISLDKEVFTQDDCGDNVVTITATDACGNSDTATANVTVECAYDLNLVLTVDNATPQIGDKVMYMVTVTNELGYPATGVSVESILPNGLMSPDNISNGGSASGNTVSWSDLTIPANGSITLSYKAMVIAGTDYVVVAEITGADEPDIDSTPGNGADTNGTGGIGSQDNDGTQDPGDEDDGDDAVIEPTGKISGTVKTDDDNNGSGDTGLAGVTINLVDSNGNIVQSTTTDGSGFYEFTNVPAGDYFIEEVDLPGYSDVSDTDDTTGANDPDGANDPTNDRIPVTLAPGEFDDGNNFVEVGLGTISGIVSEDTNGDGIGDDPISGVTITLLDSNGNTVATTTTNGTGFYEFVDLAPGNYTVVETQPNGLFDVSDEDASPDPDGADGVVDNRIPVTLDAGEDDEDNNFVEVGQGTISGFVLADEDNNDTGDLPVSGVQIVLKDAGGATIATENTNGSGFYEFVGLAPGSYTVMEMQPDGFDDVSDEDATPDPDGADGIVNNSIPVVLDAGENDADNNFIEEAFVSVGSTVFIDANNNGQQDSGENGISGIRVELYSGGNLVASTTTDGSGNYFFGDLAPGDYVVTIPNPDSAYPTSSTGNGSDNGVDGDDNGIQTSSGGSTSSPTISLLPNQETANEPFSGGNQDNAEDFNGDMTIDFGFYAPGSIGDFVWFDINGNGVQDGGEPGLGNVTVNLLDGNGNFITSTTTGSNGGYVFTGLAPGDYIVEFITPASYTEVVQTNGTTPGNSTTNSDYDPTTGRTAVISLGGGEDIAGIDAGFNLILEVSLTSFTGRYVADRELITLEWITSSEVNSDHFIVERSFENGSFQNIARVDANGNTQTESLYSTNDEDIIESGSYLYRLVMVSQDGSQEYSDVVSVTVRRSYIAEPSVKVFPNPVYDMVNVDIVKNEDDAVSVKLFDLTGKAMGVSGINITAKGNSAAIQIPVENLPRAAYILRINVGDQVFAKKITLIR